MSKQILKKNKIKVNKVNKINKVYNKEIKLEDIYYFIKVGYCCGC